MRVIALCLAALVGPGHAFGQAPLPDLKRLSLEELGSVEVTSVAKAPESVWQTAAAIHVITQEDIARSGVTSLPDALRLVPGVDVARIDTSRNWVVGIRGFGDQFSKSVLVLIDGRHTYTPLWAGVHWPIHDVVLEDVERIEVIRGPGGTIWGTNAQNGVINIITKTASDTQGTLISGVAGNVDRGLAAVRYGARRGSLAWRVYGKGTARAPQAHSDGREFDTWRMGQVGTRLDWRRGGDALTIQSDGYRATLGESVRVHTFAPPASFLVDDPVDLEGANVLARWERQTASAGSVRVQGYVDHTSRLGTDFGERRTSYDVDVTHRWRAARTHHITWGAGARTSPSEVRETLAFSTFTPLVHRFNVFSVFAQDEVRLAGDRLFLTGGAKVERTTFTNWQVQPSGRILWRPSQHHSVWGAVTRAMRTPSRVDRDISVTLLAAVTPVLTYAVLTGNDAIEPETVVGVEGGYRTLITPSLYVDVAVFRNRYAGLVDIGNGPTERRVTDGVPYSAVIVPWINGNDAGTAGFEVTPDWQVTSRLRLRGSYSLVDIDVEARPGNTRRLTRGFLETSTPRHRVSIQGLLTLGRWQVDPVYRYVGSRLGIDSYHTADLHVRVPLTPAVALTLVGQNLLQAEHEEWLRDPGPAVAIRRAAYIGVTWRHGGR